MNIIEKQALTNRAVIVMQAALSGKIIQWCNWGSDIWDDVIGFPSWNWCYFDYRIKPKEPREFWICQWWLDDILDSTEVVNSTDEIPTAFGNYIIKIIHVREVAES